MRTRSIPLLLSSLVLSATTLPAAEWFVSPQGNDTWTGLRTEAAADKSDGPFATLERAQTEVRKHLATNTAGPVTVTIRAGEYSRKEPLTLSEPDSGTPTSPVLWHAFPGERPKIKGTIRFNNWTPWKDGIQRADLGTVDPKLIHQLLLAGKRQPLARYPNADPKDPIKSGWAFADGVETPVTKEIPGEDKFSLRVKPEDVRTWAHPEDAEVIVFARYNWWNDRVSVSSFSPETRTIQFKTNSTYPVRFGNRYFVQGPLEELDAPGEWHVDPRRNQIYFRPPAGTQPSDAEAVIAKSLLLVKKANHIAIEGLHWEGAEMAAVTFEGTKSCRFAGNMITNTGDWYGDNIRVIGGQSMEVRSNTVKGAGRDAILITGGVPQILESCRHIVENNDLHNFGFFFKQGSGIRLKATGAIVRRNWIHNGPRFGIYHEGNNNLIEGNHLHDLCLETTDGGAIYSNGRDWLTPRGTVIQHNYIHDIRGLDMPNGVINTPQFAFGIYLDDCSGGADLVGNIVTRCSRSGIFTHFALDILVKNNVLADNGERQLEFTGATWESFLPLMSANYEKVANLPAWESMRGIKTHPKVSLASGNTVRGSRFEHNVMVSDNAVVPVVKFTGAQFSKNQSDHNLFWAQGGEIGTGVFGGGPSEGPGLIPRFGGFTNGLPSGWRLVSQMPADTSKPYEPATSSSNSALRMIGQGKFTPAVAGPRISLEPGATYRFAAKFRASHSGKMAIGMFPTAPQTTTKQTPRPDFKSLTTWESKEWIFVVPDKDTEGWTEKLAEFYPRIEWLEEDGWLEVSALALNKAKTLTEWECWLAKDLDTNSIVADPLFKNKDTWEFQKESPVWALGFQRIPFEKIGLYIDAWRKQLP